MALVQLQMLVDKQAINRVYIMKHKNNQAVTLMELMVALILLGAVVLTAYTLELSMRRMQVKPSVQTKILNELIPAIEMIDKDFNKKVGYRFNASLWITDINECGHMYQRARVVIIPDTDNSGNITSSDEVHAYWFNCTNRQILYSPSNSSANVQVVANGVDFFSAESLLNGTALKLMLRGRKDGSANEDPITNPGVNLTVNVFSHMTSGR